MRIYGPAALNRAVRRLIVPVAILAVGLAPSMEASAESPIPMLVTVDQAIVLRLGFEAGAIIIGNPSIADATVINSMTIVVTGRSFGTTNLIVLDSGGNVLADELITVQAALDQVVVYRRSVRQTYSCTPICAPTLNVGDGDPAFQTTNGQIQARQALALGN
jgi:Flp pilus assembly secretin CpaC